MNILHKSLLSTSIVSICSTVAFSVSAATVTSGTAVVSTGGSFTQVTAGFSGFDGTAEVNAEATPNTTTSVSVDTVRTSFDGTGNGTIRVIGDGTSNSASITTRAVRIGGDTNSTLEVLNGGRLTYLRDDTGRAGDTIIGTSAVIGSNAFGTAGSTDVVVDGAGSLLEVNGRLSVGFTNAGEDNLTISNGGRIVVKEPDNFADRVIANFDAGEGASGAVSLGVSVDDSVALVNQALDTIAITGAGSELVFSSGLFTTSGNNRIVVSDGGAIRQNETGDLAAYLAQLPSSFDEGSFGIGLGSTVGESSLTVEGSGSEVSITRDVRIGFGEGFAGYDGPCCDNPVFAPSSAEVTVQDNAILSTTRNVVVSDAAGGGTGFLTVASGGRVEANQVIVNTGGLLSGDGGTIASRCRSERWHDRSGASPGIMNIDGYLEILDGLLSFEIGGSAFGMFDQLFVSGDLITPNGLNIEISFLDSFFPQMGDTFDFLTVGGDAPIFGDPNAISFSFLGDNPGLDFSFNSGGFSAVVTGGGGVSPVPLPASLPLLLAAIGVLGWRSRKAKAA